MRASEGLRQRRVVVDEGRLDQPRLHEIPEQLQRQLARVPLRVVLHLAFVSDSPQLLQGGLDGDLATRRLAQPVEERQPPPLPIEVDGSLVGVDLPGTDGVGGGDDDVVDQLRDGPLITPRLVGLQHREFRGMRRVDALVAKHPPHLVDTIRATDHGAFEVQLQRDAQTHVDVEGVEVRGEGPGCGAAVDELQLRGLHLDVTLPIQGVADGVGDGGAFAHHGARILPGDQIDVAAAYPALLGQLLVQHGERAQRLRRHPPPFRHHRQFTAFRRDDTALHPDVIAQIDVRLPGCQGLRSDLRQGQHHLEAFTVVAKGETVLKGREGQLAGVADEHDAPPDLHHIVGFLPGFQVTPALTHLEEGVAADQVGGIGLGPCGQQPCPLLLADRRLLRVGGFGCLGTRFSHGRESYRSRSGPMNRQRVA